jgi:hypothetical protein
MMALDRNERYSFTWRRQAGMTLDAAPAPCNLFLFCQTNPILDWTARDANVDLAQERIDRPHSCRDPEMRRLPRRRFHCDPGEQAPPVGGQLGNIHYCGQPRRSVGGAASRGRGSKRLQIRYQLDGTKVHRFQAGDRVRLSELGRARFPARRTELGTVSVEKRRSEGNSVRVLFDGSKNTARLHESFIEPAYPEQPAVSTPKETPI